MQTTECVLSQKKKKSKVNLLIPFLYNPRKKKPYQNYLFLWSESKGESLNPKVFFVEGKGSKQRLSWTPAFCQGLRPYEHNGMLMLF